MRRPFVIVCVLVGLLAGCGPEICAGVDGACVALTLSGGVEIDGLDITLSGAASGRRVAPGRAEVATLPVHVALQLPSVAPGALDIRVVAVRLGIIVGGGEVSIPIGRDEHASASVELGAISLDGGLTSSNDLSCPTETTRCGPSCCAGNERCTEQGCVACGGGFKACGDVCCATGEVCESGVCALPFKSAELFVYLCPDFNSGCSASAFTAAGVCAPLQAAKAGTCYGTGLTVEAGKSYALASCQSCPSNCATTTNVMTPSAGFATQTFYSGTYFYCKTPCTAPTSCP